MEMVRELQGQVWVLMCGVIPQPTGHYGCNGVTGAKASLELTDGMRIMETSQKVQFDEIKVSGQTEGKEGIELM